MRSVISKIVGIVVFCLIIVLSVTLATNYINEQIHLPNGDSVLGSFEGKLPTPEEEEELVAVWLDHDDNCVVISENPTYVTKGKHAYFQVVFKENYTLDTIEGGRFYDGRITVRDCTSDCRASISSKKTATYYSFDYKVPDASLGTVECNRAIGMISDQSTIVLNAKPKEGKTFLGWSCDETVVNGGKMVSYSTSYTFKPKDDIVLYPNFLEEGYAIIKYNLNGGVLASDGVTDTIITQFNTKIKPCPNLLGNLGDFYREGHTLLEYTTNPDGSGEAINPGGVALIPDTGILEVWCQWSQWTSDTHFQYSIEDDAITIYSYNENAKTVSIPNTIAGYPVEKIKAEAFISKSFDTLVLPPSITTIEAGAFKDCLSFNTLYIHDTFTSIPDNAFTNCKAFSNLRLNAGRPPSYSKSPESITTRFEVLRARRDDKPLIMIVGGSSCLYGVKAVEIEKQLGGRYQVLNCGTNAGGTGMLYIEGLSSFMREGDIVISVPEYSATQMGEFKFYWRTFRATESCYNLYRYVDMSKYTHFFSAFTEFNGKAGRGEMGYTSYDITNTSLSEKYCDYTPVFAYENRTWNDKTPVFETVVNDERINNINKIINIVKTKKIGYLFSCAPIYGYSFANTKEDIDKYTARMTTKLACPFISDPKNYIFAYNEYCNSIYHLTTEAAFKRSRLLASDILAYLNAQ